MKNSIFVLAFLTLLFNASAQTKERRNHLSAGFGFQQYNGDLGNTFYSTDEEWYGVGRLSFSRYINRSFDLHLFGTLGDYGHCNEDEINNPGALNMRSRLKTFGVSIKYKFANGYLLKDKSALAPYVYFGAGINSLKDIWVTGNRVNNGQYQSVNAGLGLSYRFAKYFDVSYNVGFGYFTSDALDFISHGKNDMYLQNTLSIGYSF